MNKPRGRKALITSLSFSICSAAFAEDIETSKGDLYRNVTVNTVEPDQISITHDAGVARILFTDLPVAIQQKYGYDPAKAASAVQERELAAQEKRKSEAEAAQRAAEESVTKNTKTIREVESDQLAFLDKPFFLQGTIEVSSYYNYGYSGFEATHYSFEIRDTTGSGHAYMERAKAIALRERLLTSGKALTGVFSVVLLKNRYDQSMSLHLELLDCQLQTQ